MVQLVCFGPCFLQGSQLFLVMPSQQSKISGKYVFLYLPVLKEHIPVFIFFFVQNYKSYVVLKLHPPCRQGPKHTSCTIVPQEHLG
jgi:hypothetical protein